MVLAPARPAPKPGQKPGKLTAPSTIDRRLSGVVVTARRQLKLQLAEDVAEEARALLKAKVKEMEKAGETRGQGRRRPCSSGTWRRSPHPAPRPVRDPGPVPDDDALRHRRT
ncbi:hypothetical protein [Streptomyces sp. NPDC058424]|uniref:hypothetical protein n=1 Tax=Streptomyces sp. NPDC058424 TaxID=3346491 RepID=UPI0036681CC8